jgi:hypothetical protein
MFGKHFESMYTGSMVGKGSAYFAVWGYVISHARPDDKVGGYVELNPVLLAMILGEEQEEVERVVREMCEPDPRSRTKDMDGRKLVRLGEYSYQVVNHSKYRFIVDEVLRKEQNKAAQARHREKVKLLEKFNGKKKRSKSTEVMSSEAYQRITERDGVKAADEAFDRTQRIESAPPSDPQPTAPDPDEVPFPASPPPVMGNPATAVGGESRPPRTWHPGTPQGSEISVLVSSDRIALSQDSPGKWKLYDRKGNFLSDCPHPASQDEATSWADQLIRQIPSLTDAP